MDDNRRYEAFVRNRITELREQKLLGQSHYVNGGHKNGMNTRLLGILLHIILHISTFNHSS